VGKSIMSHGMDISLRADPSIGAIASPTIGKLMLNCSNPSMMPLSVSVVGHSSSALTVAKTGFIGGAAGPDNFTVNGRPNLKSMIPMIVDRQIGEWTAAGKGGCRLEAKVDVTNNFASTNTVRVPEHVTVN
jgi:hypothetical protein